MRKLNVILVYNKEEDKILMCKSEKKSYKNKLDLISGKVENGEDEVHAAYRKLNEETGITDNDIILTNMMNFEYKTQNTELGVFVGKLNKDVEFIKESNYLQWVDKTENFFDIEKFAGEGNIGHVICQSENHKNELF